jgi:hypothetical protein
LGRCAASNCLPVWRPVESFPPPFRIGTDDIQFAAGGCQWGGRTGLHIVDTTLDPDELDRLSLDHPRRGLCSPLLPRCSQRHTEFRCLLISGSYAPLQSASNYRCFCLLSCEGFECTDVLFRPIPPLHRLLCHLCSPSKSTAQSAPHVEQKCLMIGD